MSKLKTVEFIGGPACGKAFQVERVRQHYTYESEDHYFAEYCPDGRYRAFHEGRVTSDVEADC